MHSLTGPISLLLITGHWNVKGIRHDLNRLGLTAKRIAHTQLFPELSAQTWRTLSKEDEHDSLSQQENYNKGYYLQDSHNLKTKHKPLEDTKNTPV